MKQLFECGKVILFCTGENGFKNSIGIILKYKKDKDEYVIISNNISLYKNIKSSWIENLENIEKVKNSIEKYWDEKIDEQKKLIRKPSQEEKNEEKKKKYEELKNQIKIVAARLVDSKDDTDFENRLKAIADMKKSIFAIELDCSSEIRKENGRIKAKINELERNKNTQLNNISDENIEKILLL